MLAQVSEVAPLSATGQVRIMLHGTHWRSTPGDGFAQKNDLAAEGTDTFRESGEFPRRAGPGYATAPRPVAQVIRDATHEVQRPVFYAIAIIITAYLPIFTLQRVEGRLFRPMALTVAFALLGALMFSILIAPVLSSVFFRRGAREWHNPVVAFLTARYRRNLRWAIGHRWITLGVGLVALGASAYLAFSGVIGSEFLPHLDEGAIWARGTLADSTNLTEGTRFADQCRLVFAAFPEVTKVVSE